MVVLAGGSVESPRLYRNSGLPDPHDVVGRYLTTHLQDIVTGFFDREIHSDVGQVTMTPDRSGFGRYDGTLATCDAQAGRCVQFALRYEF